MAKQSGTTRASSPRANSANRGGQSVKIDGKTFRFVDGVATISMNERQSRINKLVDYIRKNNLKGYRLLEGSGKIFR